MPEQKILIFKYCTVLFIFEENREMSLQRGQKDRWEWGRWSWIVVHWDGEVGATLALNLHLL